MDGEISVDEIEETKVYYVIERSYEGPNPDQHPDNHTVLVQTHPGLGNMSRQPILNGWLGTTNDWYKYAHGSYETLDEAKAKIDDLCYDYNGYRVDELTLEDCEMVVYRVHVGRLEPWSASDSQYWCWEDMKNCIDANSTDDDILNWSEECANSAADEGGLLDLDAVVRMAMQYRDEKAAALAEDDDED